MVDPAAVDGLCALFRFGTGFLHTVVVHDPEAIG